MSVRRVLIVVRPASGGQRQHLVTLLRGLDRSRYEPMVAGAIDPQLRQLLGSLDVEGIALPVAGGLDVRDVQACMGLRSLVRQRSPDLIHGHGAKSAMILAGAGLLGHGPPVVYTLHGFTRTAAASALFVRGEAAVARRVTRVIAVSSALGEWAVHHLGVSPERIAVIPNAIDWDRFGKEPVPDPQWAEAAPGGPRIGTVARLSSEKGVDILTRALAVLRTQAPDATLHVVGDGPDRHRLLARARASGVLQHVRLWGQLPPERIPGFLAGLTVYVQPSRREGLGLAALEAMAEGLPVVVTSVGGLPELVGENERGLSVAPNADAIAAGILRALGSEGPVWAQAAGRFARSFTVERQIAATQDVYDSAVAAKATGGG